MIVIGKERVCGPNAVHVATSAPVYTPGGVLAATANVKSTGV
jgi:hypothetical protein